MKARAGLLIFAVALLQGCAGLAPTHRQSIEDARGQELIWGRMQMRLPSGWVIGAREDGTGLIARSPSTNEEVHVTQYQSKAEHADETPTQHIQRFVDEQSPPDPESPEVKDVVPFAPFDMPGGEPATMRIQDLGGNELAVQYAIALPAGELYAVNFYCTGYSESAVSGYSKIVRNARIAPDQTVTLGP